MLHRHSHLLLLALVVPGIAGAQTRSPIAPYIAPAFPEELVAAKKVDRIAWLAYDRGQRNVYTAAAPDFKPVRITRFLEDDGVVLSSLEISDDGATVTFLRGSERNTRGWVADPTSNPNGEERAVWAARTTGGDAWRLGLGEEPSLSPDGRMAAFARDSEIYVYAVSKAPRDSIERALKPLVRVWGRNLSPRWSPDGSRLAFVSVRDNHSFIGVYDVAKRRVTFMAPSVDYDASPSWSADGKRLAFIRRPGTPFGQQAQRGTGSIGNPSGPAVGRGGRGGRGGFGADTGRADGLYRAAFRGGYTISLMVADVATGNATEVWHNQPADRTFANINSIIFAGDHLIFQQEPEEWIRWYSVSADGQAATAPPVELTPGDGAAESFGLSPDGKTLFYATNAGDIDRRHVWKVPTSGGPATQITTGTDIEMYPVPLASGKQVALLSSGPTRPMQVGIVPLAGTAARKLIFPALSAEYLALAQVAPEPVLLKAEDGLEFHNQLFLPKGIAQGERRPAIIFVHGGPIRQMLLGYHYMDFYHMAYAVNEWLASQGYIVMSVNYRSGIGYGKSFRTAANTGGRGNAEYRDVIAAGKYLQSRPDVDPARVGIWGLSYGGVLTSQALARNSDVFAAGVDMAGVHLWGNSLDTASVSYKASTISEIDNWKSPVLIWQNDDDRNVDFSQTIGLVDLLRARNVYFELMVNPDDTHETLLHRRWLELYPRIQTFFERFLKNRGVSTQ